MSNIKSLIDAISTGDSIGTEQSFNAAMAEKISTKLDTMRQDIAQTMFATEEYEQMDEVEQIDELSRGTLKSYVKKANKSAQHYSFEPTVRDPESGNQYRPTYTKRSKGIDLAKDKIKREEVEQMDEATKNFDVHPKRAWKIAQHLNNVGIRTKTSANDDRGLANDDPGSVNITATHKDPAHLAIHIHRAVDAHAQDHALSARMRGQLRASGVEPKPMKKEEVE